tara:strand:+ start:438 stop:659 length:222 start_codon:yes stop_codon:yes gene_type:complete
MKIIFMNKKLFYLIFVSNFIFCKDGYAYLDPGTGSIIVQAIVALFAIAIGFLSYWWSKFKEGFKKLIAFFKKK